MQRAWDDAVEAARAGAIFARDQKAYESWRRRTKRETQPLSPAQLEQVVNRLARTNPEYIVRT